MKFLFHHIGILNHDQDQVHDLIKIKKTNIKVNQDLVQDLVQDLILGIDLKKGMLKAGAEAEVNQNLIGVDHGQDQEILDTAINHIKDHQGNF
jgi:hypothetical protein